MFNQSNGYSLADIAAATGRDNFMNGDGASWWVILLFLFCFGGWGANGAWGYGFGNNANNSWGGYPAGYANGAMDNYVLSSDFAAIQRQLSDTTQSLERKGDTINGGLCDGFYAQNTTMLNGFNGITKEIADSNYVLQNSMTQGRIAAMQDTNNLTNQITGLGNQLASCCCDQRYETATKFADLNYNLATQECQTRQKVNDSVTTITANQDANARSILEAIKDMQTQAMQDKIATLTADNQSLRLAASQAAQNSYLVSALSPTPQPAYIVANPYTGTSYRTCACN